MLDQLLPQILGPSGALVLAVIGLGILQRQGRKDLSAKDELFAALLLTKDADIAYERTRTEKAEARVEALGKVLNDATVVMDKSIALSEAALAKLAGKDRG